MKFSLTKHGRQINPPQSDVDAKRCPAGGPVARKRGLNSKWCLEYTLRTVPLSRIYFCLIMPRILARKTNNLAARVEELIFQQAFPPQDTIFSLEILSTVSILKNIQSIERSTLGREIATFENLLIRLYYNLLEISECKYIFLGLGRHDNPTKRKYHPLYEYSINGQ